MTGAVNGTADELVVVRVTDAVNSILSGRGDVSYQSPPLPAEEAMTLVRLLLGRDGNPREEAASWRCPIAGGQRTITIESLSELDARRAKRLSRIALAPSWSCRHSSDGGGPGGLASADPAASTFDPDHRRR